MNIQPNSKKIRKCIPPLTRIKGRAPLGITGIDVTNMDGPSHWELNVMSEYGAKWDRSVISGFAWRLK